MRSCVRFVVWKHRRLVDRFFLFRATLTRTKGAVLCLLPILMAPCRVCCCYCFLLVSFSCMHMLKHSVREGKELLDRKWTDPDLLYIAERSLFFVGRGRTEAFATPLFSQVETV